MCKCFVVVSKGKVVNKMIRGLCGWYKVVSMCNGIKY